MLVTSFHHPAVSQSSHEERFELREVAQSTRDDCMSVLATQSRPLCLQEGMGRGRASVHTGVWTATRCSSSVAGGLVGGEDRGLGEVDVQPP